MQEISVSREESGQRLDKYLRRRLPLATSSFIYKMLRKKNITLQGRKADGSEKVETGDIIRLFLSDETIEKFSRQRDDEGTRREADEGLEAYRKLQPLLGRSPVIYEDDNILAVRKPSGVLSQKAKASDLSMNEWLRGYLASKNRVSEEETEGKAVFRPSVCNRLDRNTGGILLCAKTLPGSRALSAVIRDRMIRKTYTMVVHGQIREPGIIENELIKDRELNRVQVADPVQNSVPADGNTENRKHSRRAVTVYRPVQIGKKVTIVEADLITGRSHQLRVHMASIGHPIVSDPKYGDQALDRALLKGLEKVQKDRVLTEVREKGTGRKSRMIHREQLLWCSQVSFPESFSGLSDEGEMSEVLACLAGRGFECPHPGWWMDLLRV